MSPLDALKTMADAYPGGVESLLPRINPDKALEVFKKELRGSPGFKLAVTDAARITEFCHELGVPSATGLARKFCELVGGKFVESPGQRAAPDAAGVLCDVVQVLREHSDVVREVTAAGLDGRYTANEVKRIEREADEAIAAIQRMVADVRAAHEAGKPAHLRVAAGGAG